MKNWFKKNKKKAVIIAIVLLALILFVVFLIAIIKYLVPNSGESVYGDRCKITENYPVAKDKKDKIVEFLNDYKNTELVEYEVKCNLIDVVVKVDDSVKLSTVKSMGKKLLGVFTEEELEHYDIQLLVESNKDDSSVYPVIGTHHKKINGSMNNNFVW